MRVRWWLAAMSAAVVILIPQRAEAGGSWLETDRGYYSVGDHVVVRGTFGPGSLEGKVGDGPFHAYLAPGERAWDDLLAKDALYLGPMVITEARGAVCCWVAEVEFTVPDVPAGRYWIDYCNDPCTIDGIGDLIGGLIFVGDTEREARLAARLERARARVERMGERLDQAAAEVAALESRPEGPNTQEAPVGNAASQIPRGSPWDRPVISIEGAALISGALLAFAAALILRRRRSKQLSMRRESVLQDAGGLLAGVESINGQERGAGLVVRPPDPPVRELSRPHGMADHRRGPRR